MRLHNIRMYMYMRLHIIYVQLLHETTYVQHMHNMRLHTCVQHDATYVQHVVQELRIFSVVYSLLNKFSKVDRCYVINQCTWAYDEHEYHMLPVAIKRAIQSSTCSFIL